MNKKIIVNTLIFSMFGGLIAATVSCKNNDTVIQNIKKYLTVDVSKVKTNYFVGDTFDKSNLVVKLVTEKDGVKDEGIVTNDYYLNIEDTQPLTIEDEEIIVISNSKDVKSATFDINVKYKPISKEDIIGAIRNLREKGNYTVETKIGKNTIKGIVANNGVVWESSEPTYFYEDVIGYSTYDDLTFSFNFNSGEVKSAKYLIDQNCYDEGLFNSETRDSFNYRVPNYSINNMTDEEFDYLSKQEVDKYNKIVINPENGKWAFNTVGHKDASYNPKLYFKGGLIYISINNAKDIIIETVPSDSGTVEAEGSISVIKNIGSTTIPKLDEFLKNPTFPSSNIDRDLISLMKLIRGNNYKITSTVDNASGIYTKDYSLVENINRDKQNASSLTLNEPNDFDLDSGLYRVSHNGITWEIKKDFQMPYSSTSYLETFDFFEHLKDIFVKQEDGTYLYKIPESAPDEETDVENITPSQGANLSMISFAEVFLGGKPEVWELDDNKQDQLIFPGTSYDKFTLKINKEGKNITSFEIAGYGDNLDDKGIVQLGTITVTNFGTSKNADFEQWLKDWVYSGE